MRYTEARELIEAALEEMAHEPTKKNYKAISKPKGKKVPIWNSDDLNLDQSPSSTFFDAATKAKGNKPRRKKA